MNQFVKNKMPISLNAVSKEHIESLENKEKEEVLFKGDEVQFIYNRLNVGKGTLYITKKNFIWLKEKTEEKKKEEICFKEYSSNNIYLNYYERNRKFYSHLLNEVDSITVCSSKIALHALSTDGKLSNGSSVYIQLNENTFEESYNMDDEVSEEENIKENEEKENEEKENGNIEYSIIPEIILVGKNENDTSAIFEQLSNIEHRIDIEDLSDSCDNELEDEDDDNDEEEELTDDDVEEEEEEEEEFTDDDVEEEEEEEEFTDDDVEEEEEEEEKEEEEKEEKEEEGEETNMRKLKKLKQ